MVHFELLQFLHFEGLSGLSQLFVVLHLVLVVPLALHSPIAFFRRRCSAALLYQAAGLVLICVEMSIRC